MTKPAPLLLAAFVASVGCAAIPEEERALLTEPVECSRASDRISALEAAKPGDVRKAQVLASTLGAAGLAIAVVTDDVRDRERVLSGEYEAELEARISEIGETCST